MRDPIVERYRDEPPSLVMHIYPTHFKFEHQDGVFLLTGVMKNFLQYIKDRRLPPDLIDVFEEANCPFYEGCIIVEIRDHRSISYKKRRTRSDNDSDTSLDADESTVATPDEEGKSNSNSNSNSNDKTVVTRHPRSTYRISLQPTEECLWSDICMLNEQMGMQWSQDTALELEARILLATAPPLCLEPNVDVMRVSNAICYAQSRHRPLAKRKWNSSEMEEEAVAQAEHEKLMLLMDEKHNRPFQPTFGKINFMQDWRRKRAKADQEPTPTLDAASTTNTRKGSQILLFHRMMDVNLLVHFDLNKVP
ncbi:Spt20 family-domain-containing protein [Syncephalis plumigaleata]|nr:Spt20 family-domain-containing protein [Syncephalis plumigaleata]